MNTIKDVISFIESSLSVRSKLLIGALILTLGTVLYLRPEHSLTDSTAMITNFESRSGGTGVVLSSSDQGSIILTNSHVCGVVANGGLVHDANGRKHIVSGYKRSNLHDLCLISVKANLGINSAVAASAPKLFSRATVSGHPHLLPTVLTEGNFSGSIIINVVVGFKPCDPNLPPIEKLLCTLFGAVPDIRTYESQLVTATIMPGSSGSAIYNSDKEIAGLVFAGSGDFGYAFAVPQAFVHDFVTRESNLMPFSVPSNDPTAATAPSQKKIKSVCSVNENADVAKVCEVLLRANDIREF